MENASKQNCNFEKNNRKNQVAFSDRGLHVGECLEIKEVKMDYRKIGTRIKTRRVYLNETQENVAIGAKVTKTFISNIENFKADNIDIGKLHAICVYLSLDFGMFVKEVLKND